MLTSLNWLNRYLAPSTLAPDEAEAKLIAHSFPIETREEKQSAQGPDTVFDVEVTSNRGDCLCHLGLARELAATTGRRLLSPEPRPRVKVGARTDAVTSVLNHVPEVCPRFTARVIRDVKVGASPAWLVSALESVGQRSINNVVDVSNFVLHELGHPSHTFDLNTLSGKRLIVRKAHEGEKLTALDKRAHTLKSSDVVVADAERAVSLAGVIGGLDTGVTERTTDVLLEVATWDPATIRRTARRLEIRTDASHRFERIVAAGDLEWASARAAELILEVAGGELCEGVIDTSAEPDSRHVVAVRPERIEHVLGLSIEPGEVRRLLEAIGVEVQQGQHRLEASTARASAVGTWTCTIPHHRPDITREIDVIEEVARLHGLDNFRISPTIGVRLDMKQPVAWSNREKATALVSETLTGLGFFETVTVSFATQAQAAMFLPAGLRSLRVDEARRPGNPYLRPSIIPSLLTCRRANQDARVTPPSGGGVRLFEMASVFAEADDGKAAARQTREQRHVGLIADAGASVESSQGAIRTLRGAVEHAALALGRGSARLAFEPMTAPFPGADGASCAGVRLNGQPAGYIALASRQAQDAWGLDERVAIAEVSLGMLTDLFPSTQRVSQMPAFPGIERDLSVVVAETIRWSEVESLIAKTNLHLLESCRFVGTYRGKQTGPGKKSVTLRLGFRDASRTLRHEEVDPQIAAAVAALKGTLGAELRS